METPLGSANCGIPRACCFDFYQLTRQPFAMKNHPDNLRSKANAGFSLIEVMVGMVIALLGTIIIFQVFSISEGVKRTTTSGGDALQNGAAALSALENSLKNAGYGFFYYGNAGTDATWIITDPDPVPLPVPPIPYAPLSIKKGTATTSDSITITYRLDGRNIPAVGGGDCSVVVPTGLDIWLHGPYPPDLVEFPAAITPPALTTETIKVVANANGHLQLCSNIYGVIADDIVLMKAEYGTDKDGNGKIEGAEWNQDAPADVMKVYAVRLAVVARSAQPEVTRDVAGAITTCATTTTNPTWVDSATLPLDISGQPDLLAAKGPDEWKCYRYKTFEITVPLRNVKP
jgi:type IV pilus assembly protein PilW